MSGQEKMTSEQHKERHIKLHQMLDELAADFIQHTGQLPSQTSILELMEWSHRQALEPVEGTTKTEPALRRLKFHDVIDLETDTQQSIDVTNKKGEWLGEIRHDDQWKCHTWEQDKDIKMSSGCLQQVVDKMRELDGGKFK